VHSAAHAAHGGDAVDHRVIGLLVLGTDALAILIGVRRAQTVTDGTRAIIELGLHEYTTTARV